MTEELICENCGCPFLCQEDDGYYCEDCERYYSFYDAFALMGLSILEEHTRNLEEKLQKGKLN